LLHRNSRWPTSHRIRAYFLANNATGPRTVRFPAANDGIVQRTVEAADLGARYLDFGFAGNIAQCDEGDGTCAVAREMIPESEGWTNERLMQHKYLCARPAVLT
jgi:hypothetical protein